VIFKIFEEWKGYAINMGSHVIDRGSFFVSYNNHLNFSCDHSNNIISIENDVNCWQVFGITSIVPVQKYIIMEKKYAIAQNVNIKKASLMVLSKSDFVPSKSVDKRCSIVEEISYNDIYSFVDVVFDAFNYDRRNFSDSLAAYQVGYKSGMVHYYGLYLNGNIVSAVMVHRNIEGWLFGLELVSTRKQFQRKGYSKLLLELVLDSIFKEKGEIVWLFSIENSIAENIYKKLGFDEYGKILISNCYTNIGNNK
jgi:ribosomal protein S18 acetylase RimI-like enzyme